MRALEVTRVPKWAPGGGNPLDGAKNGRPGGAPGRLGGPSPKGGGLPGGPRTGWGGSFKDQPCYAYNLGNCPRGDADCRYKHREWTDEEKALRDQRNPANPAALQ